ncbi:uncharacterized protein LOC133918597 isoform X2 [Phragmites australis]|uniref:uncharacterized protein LOC133918597 isoform X2 n=1 Tax=Phragmites australis TaxID=29695 RepID=UPI002D7A343A|nr:uncharacterized protein LOC133918597 isoform X2 [Phragmites australis]
MAFSSFLFFSLTPLFFLVLRDSLVLRGPKCTKNQRHKDCSPSVSASPPNFTINTPAHTHLTASPSHFTTLLILVPSNTTAELCLGKMNRKPGDWDCRACQHLNFSRRDLCQRCGEPRGAADRGSAGGDYANFGGRGSSSLGGGGFGVSSDVRPGDWYCSCGAHNFASRSNCFKCSAFKEEAAVNSGAGTFDGDMSRSRGYGFGGAARTNRPGWKSGDWICTRSGCNEHNFASRMECFRCNAPRDSGTEV